MILKREKLFLRAGITIMNERLVIAGYLIFTAVFILLIIVELHINEFVIG